MLTPKGPKLAPLYDLMCTAVYDGLTDKMAMAIGGEYRPDWVTGEKWQGFANEIGIGFKLIQKDAKGLASTLPERAQTVMEEIQSAYGEFSMSQAIMSLIERRCSRLNAAMNS